MTASRIPSVEGGIQPTLLTAKGDLLTASATSTVTNLPVGADGQTLVANSASASGLQWQSVLSPYAAGKNAIINGGMDIWQRNTSVAGAANSTTFTADRWNAYRGAAGSTFSRQVTGDTTNLPNIQYCVRVQRDSGNTSTAGMVLDQSIESANSIPFAGKTVTFSFYARAGANYTGSGSNIEFQLRSGTGTDQNDVTGFTGAANVALVNPTLTTTWQRFSATGTVAATATELAMKATYIPTGTAGANDYYEVTGFQVEIGSVPTTFTRAGGTIQGELAACQRYYWRFGGNSSNQRFGNGLAYSATAVFIEIVPPVPMRVSPTAIEYSTLMVFNATQTLTPSAIALNNSGPFVTELLATTVGATVNSPFVMSASSSTSAYLAFTAEL